ncbi:MAG: pentapeptide repeat-containing protein [Deltaproteobacteria bacterium]|nr:pentapeptide repeat-containing protein [Deltaproteobacteria bacterium]
MSAKYTGLVLLLALVGCGGEDEASLDRVTGALEVGNGVRLNGVRLNGVRLNGVRLNGVRLNGVALSGVSLVSGALQGINSKGVLLSGTTLIGSELTGDADTGPITIRVDGAVQVGKGGTALWYYQLSASVDGTWSPVCELDANGNAYGALLTRGVWNQDQGVPGGGAWTDDGRITIACANSAIAKCLDAGYRPWALGEEANPTCG